MISITQQDQYLLFYGLGSAIINIWWSQDSWLTNRRNWLSWVNWEKRVGKNLMILIILMFTIDVIDNYETDQTSDQIYGYMIRKLKDS